ncbi:PREDICTED: GLABROUS1 enhancer-binding protein-like 2 [Camelina sativa]|uniref:GLABROUS1 enhancer-binding protein-like 2 n=1 Tax=Camelina sativa TaxID=90675 RepID=A0ABM1RG06_CAMSA|nr:PREDICTED: GLABROUS1 enhancer-binding protein-like 2 [Camelina sativa]
MATPTQLDFSSPGVDGGYEDDDDTSPLSASLSRRKSQRKRSSKRAAAASETVTVEEETKKKKRKKVKNSNNNNDKVISPMNSNRIWNEEDELAILKGLVDYRAKTGYHTKIDWDAFYRYIGGSIHVKVTKDQLSSKIRKLKKKFLDHMLDINEGIDPHFTRSSDSEAFGFSMMIWGENNAQLTNGAGVDKPHQSENEEEVEEVALIDNGAAKSDFDGKSHHEAIAVDKITTENGTAGKENDDDDELCAVQDAFETMMAQGLSDYQKKLRVKKLMSLETEKRRELSNEWKALCDEESKLSIKKLRFTAKLAEAAN